ncbi:MAG TPA: beta-propeller fold lactonase family protein [Candidatus Bathyarchaeia archaeon]|nr:beta-propeller fold lactonase family protein [Candidatus Bathyarchaeia archaeon]
MKTWTGSLLSAVMPLALAAFCSAGSPAAQDAEAQPTGPINVVVNQDIGFPTPNAIRFFQATGTQLTYQSDAYTGGFGIQGGFFGTSRVNSVPSLSAPCLYVSDAGSNDIASISLGSKQTVGNFTGSQTDDGSSNGIGLAVNANYLYASFTKSNTIGTFALQSGCGLIFLGDVPAVGLQGGSVSGMAVNGSMLVVAYGDGSVQSFKVSGGMPVSNQDRQNSTGYGGGISFGAASVGNMPSGVDITQDGRFALFGDISATATVEVSSLTAGKLAPTVVYKVGNGVDAGAIRLSPDQSLVYIANSESGSVSAAFFNKTTGRITPGCMSPTLRGFNSLPWLGSVVTRDTSGTGTVLYVAEFGRDYLEINHGLASEIGILNVTSNGVSCTLAEAMNSPVQLSYPGALSMGVYPPRPF